MSFVWKAAQPLKAPEQVAAEVLEVALARGLDQLAAVLAVMCIAQESGFWCPWNAADPTSKNYPNDSQSDDGRSVGYFQQQNGRAGETVTGSDNWWGPMSQRMDLKQSCNEFLARLEDNYGEADNNPARAGQFIQNVQRSAYPDAYTKHWDRAWQLVRAAAAGAQPPSNGGTSVPDNRPDFNEYPNWTRNNSPRGGRRPDLFLLHTQEGDGNADSLSRFLRSTEGGSNPVSYHYTISEDYTDHGVTVVDVVDTDFASWSVGNSNWRSINLCFAGSRASWSRQQWLKQSRAIDVAAYLAVQDCKKYGIDMRVIAPPYPSDPPGISDHRYCTQHLRDGNDHTDVGDQFPWDVFAAAIAKYAGEAPPPQPPPAADGPVDVDREIWDQLRIEWPQLGNQTLVNAVGEIRDRLLGVEDYANWKAGQS
jgi:N-acetyl-anhydromuramyl-L-alanine amidase AmpD